MEYMQPRKLDVSNDNDKRLIKEYFSAVDEGQADGMKVQFALWHK